MTAAFLQSELANLISDSKRKHVEVKAASEKSLTELKSISVTSETQLAGDLVRKPYFIEPFILALQSSNVKLASTGAACLQRLVASTAIPRTRLSDILQAFEIALPLALEVQLKVLQTLPSLLQLYAADLHGEALARTLNVSADLSGSKLPVISSTAGATFQQLVTTVFERTTTAASSKTHLSENGSEAAHGSDDALKIFLDICALLAEQKPCFVKLGNLAPPAVLETIETLLSEYGAWVLQDANILKACSEWLVPGICTLIENSTNYGVVVRAFRIALIFATQHVQKLPQAVGELLKVIHRTTDRAANSRWKRVLSLEFFKNFCEDFDALRTTFALFDLDSDQPSIVSDLMASLVRTASEDPSLIGLGRFSTTPSTSLHGRDASTDIGALTPSISTPGKPATGISTEWSSVTTACLDMVDRANPPDVPGTYLYTLVLGCVAAFSDGLSKFIMPLSLPNRKSSKREEPEGEESDDSNILRRASMPNNAASQKYQQLINPLDRKDSSKSDSVELCAKMIEVCWPAILAICSTFLNAKLDSYYYHILVRSVQKLSQVSGVLQLDVSRDALLTTLAKASLPVNVSSLMNAYYGTRPALQSDLDAHSEEDDPPVRSPIASTSQNALGPSIQSVNVRNLLCMRALLNLGIALGPTLSLAAWTVILQALEQIEALVASGPGARTSQAYPNKIDDPETSASTNLVTETTAVDTAKRRMVEGTRTYSNRAFSTFCQALWQMIEDVMPSGQRAPVSEETSNDERSAMNGLPRPKMLTHRSLRSISSAHTKSAALEVDVRFVLGMIERLASTNSQRFRNSTAASTTWNLVVDNLLLLHNSSLLPELRLQCVHTINTIVVETCTLATNDDDEVEASAQSFVVVQYGIPALHKQIRNCQRDLAKDSNKADIALKTAQSVLEALYNVVGSCGESLGNGWSEVFNILDTVLSGSQELSSNIEVPLYSAAFKVVLLVVSDFLASLNTSSLAALLKLFDRFAGQQADLNMSLTTSALYWNVATLIIDGTDVLEPFNFDAGASDRLGSSSTLWRGLLLGLQNQSKDSRTDIRNAALRMLTKIIEASVTCMSSMGLNSCLGEVMLPLLEFYSTESGTTWHESAQQELRDIVRIFQAYHELILDEKEPFVKTWLKLSSSLEQLCNLEDLKITTAVFDCLSQVIFSLCKSSKASTFDEDERVLVSTWTLWQKSHPASLKSVEPNETALASYETLLLRILDWKFEAVVSSAEIGNELLKSVRTSVFAARHGQYTLDVRKMSSEQEQSLEVIRKVKSIFHGQEVVFAQFIVELVSDVVERTIPGKLKNDSSSASGRKPTGIAFATACVNELLTILQASTQGQKVWFRLPLEQTLELSAELANTKYSRISLNDNDPLWRKGCSLGVECMSTVRRDIESPSFSVADAAHIEALGPAINTLATATLEATNLDTLPSERRPSVEHIQQDEQFDISKLWTMHTSTVSVHTHSETPVACQKQYVLLFFHHSLVAKPWYNDLAPAFEESPLANITKIRRGSIRSPALPLRREICYEALKCLFDFVDKRRMTEDCTAKQKNTLEIAKIAAPYVLLRVAHTLKTFIADQPLRNLEHPHPALQKELHLVLRGYVDLSVFDEAFVQSARDLGCNDEFGNVILWRSMPRLKKGLAWQDHAHGQGVEECIMAWRGRVSEGWGPQF
ncbi:Endocytosis and vacuole integrity protein [Lithohypha guttulata]|nr:Endocytosis and vacuole integrity protein [Lithohypha guttulata]